MWISNVCSMREMFSDMPFMYSIVAVVVGVCIVVCFGSSSRSVSVTLEKVFVVVVFRKKLIVDCKIAVSVHCNAS